MSPLTRFVVARTFTAAVDRLADVIAPPIRPVTLTERRQAVCADPDHADGETACPTCGQGPRER